MEVKYDFSGYATKNDTKCSDGRTIRRDAFIHNDGEKVPLVWQHQHNDPANVLGHALLENRADGVYAYAKFNSTLVAQNAKELVQHGDIKALSIYANQLRQQGKNVVHGAIREVSLVLTGANPGASIDNISFSHSDGSYDVDEEEAIIYTDEEITHGEEEDMDYEIEYEDGHDEEEELEHSGDQTIGEIFNEFNEEQKNVVYAMLAHAAKSNENSDEVAHGGEGMGTRNVFENESNAVNTLSHAEISTIFEDAQEMGSLKASFIAHAGTYGIDDIDILFPDAKAIGEYPHLIKRDDDWVAGIMSGTKKTPFTRIKTVTADITADEARAKGYVTGALKKEEVFGLLKRETGPTTIYKKQKLDRDDILDITTLDVVAFLKAEMRIMLNEEIARAILIGDGRDVSSEDKIKSDKIRPIFTDHEMYTHRVQVEKEITPSKLVDAIVRSRKNYKGKGQPSLYTTTDVVTDLLLEKDTMGRRLYPTETELKAALRVKSIIEVEAMEGLQHTDDSEVVFDCVGILVNMSDYSVGTDKGGQVSMFDDFDIDYNQYKYLMETRMSGALVHPKTAVVIEKPVV